MNRHRVAVTGLGLVSPYGGCKHDYFEQLLAGRSAIRHLRTDDLLRPLALPFVTCPQFDAALTTVLALRHQAIPPTAHLSGRLDPGCDGVDHVMEGRRGVPLQAALSSSFAFGGSNAVLAFRAAPKAFH